MIVFLRFLFAAILVAMLVVTAQASLERGIVSAAADLWSDGWFRATLADAYFGFLTIYLWIAYRERTWLRRVVWFVLVMGLGNIAIAAYVLALLFRLEPGDPLENLFRRRPEPERR